MSKFYEGSIKTDSIRPGDGFLIYNGSFFQKLVNAFQLLVSRDGEAVYSHAGYFTSYSGTTFEARVKIGHYDIKDFLGCKVLFFRHKCMNDRTFYKHYDYLKNKSEGRIYPFYRLAFHLLPFTARWAPFDRGVCSEKVAQLYYLSEFMSYWKGIKPDYIHDMVCDPWASQWSIIYEGKFTKEVYDKLFKD